MAELLAGELETADYAPWIDLRKLLPGQNWPRAIERAIETSAFFVACFSAHSVAKKGGFQAEIRYALDCARQVPMDDIFIVPLRLDGCPVPRSILREFLYVDPATLHLPGSRRDGVDPMKLHRQVVRHSTSTSGMPPLELKRGQDGELVIYDGVTRATRVAKYLPGTLVPAEITGAVAQPVGDLPTVGEKL